MNVSVKSEGDIVIITVEGNIDGNTAPELQKHVLEATVQTSKLVIDLTKVAFVSSAGLRLLLMVYRQLKAKDGKVILAGVSEEIKEVMSMTGFINFFEITETVTEALTKF